MDPSSIRQLAALARLDLTEAETADAMVRISRVLGYCASLARVPTEDVAPSPRPMALHDRFRADEREPSSEKLYSHGSCKNAGSFQTVTTVSATAR